MPSAKLLRTYLDTAHELAWQAGKITLRYYQSDLRAEHKADSSLVTIADRETEHFLRRELMQRFPGHAVLGEEEGGEETGSEWRWIIDPIDGTHSFVQGVPFYSVMLALEYQGSPVVGVIHMPALNETVYAADGCGCYWNGRPCHVSQKSRLDQALALSYTPHFDRFGQQAVLDRLLRRVGEFRTWSDGLGDILVATGRAEISIDLGLDQWDIAAGVPILREAGGMCTDWQGKVTTRSGNALATNGVLHAEMLQIIHEATQ